MNRRKALALATWGMALLGGAVYFFPFILALGPNAKGDAALPVIDVQGIRPGEVVLMNHPKYGELYENYRWAILFYRHENGELSAWDVASEDGVLVMPDWHWWRPSGLKCHDFSPSADPNGKLLYQCHDEMEYRWHSELRWDLSGKNVAGGIADMLSTTGELSGNQFKVGKPAH